MARVTCLSVVGAILAIIGIAVLILGIVVTPKEFPKVFNNKLKQYLIVDSTHAEQYETWAGKGDIDNPYYLVIYMYNLTNVDQVVQSTATPSYDVIGPYMFRRYRQSVNVSFPNDGTQIQYDELINYYFDANASGHGLLDTDVILNINQVYISAIMQSTDLASKSPISGEVNLTLAVTGGMVRDFTDYFTGPFVTLFTAYKFPAAFTSVMNANIEAINTTYNAPQQAYNMFVDTWRNSTTGLSLGNWTGLLLTTDVPAEISFDSATMLLDPTFPFSLLDTSLQAIWYWDQAPQNPSILANLTYTFGITNSQVVLLWNWRNTVFGPTLIYPDVISQFGLDQISDIGWVQWGTLEALDGKSIKSFPDLADIGFYTQIEFGKGSPWSTWRSMMDRTTGLENLLNIQSFLKTYPGGPYTQWGLNSTSAHDLQSYIMGLSGTQGLPTIKAKMGPTGGLFVTRTVSDWVCNCNDYLLDRLRDVPPVCSFKINNTALGPNIISSGKSDINTINTFVQWEGQSAINNLWASSIPVVGHTQLGQFLPGNTAHAPYTVFQDDIVRTVNLVYSSSSSVDGIPTDRYILDFNSTFAPNPIYYQSIEGLTNMTSYHDGSPIFLGMWDMFGVPNATSWVNGLNPTNIFEDGSIIDIEPTTGMAIQSRKRMQVNAYLPPDNQAWFMGSSIFGNDKVTSGIVYPMAKIGEFGTISHPQAEKLKDKLLLSPRVKHISFYVGVTAGPILIVLGLCLIFLARRKRSEERQPLVDHYHH